VDKSAVIDASPLIFLSRGRQMELLPHFAKHIVVPEPVATEIRKEKGYGIFLTKRSRCRSPIGKQGVDSMEAILMTHDFFRLNIADLLQIMYSMSIIFEFRPDAVSLSGEFFESSDDTKADYDVLSFSNNQANNSIAEWLNWR
jgi:hypothetical protein